MSSILLSGLKKKYPLTYMADIHRTHENKKLSFKNRTWLKHFLQVLDNSPKTCVKKCVQVGVSEFLVFRAIVRAIRGRAVLHIAPKLRLVYRQVSNRFNRSIQFTRFYNESRNKKGSDSMTMKHIGKGSICFAGSNRADDLIEYPGRDVQADEYARCNQENIKMAQERMTRRDLDNSDDNTTLFVSNPELPNRDISDLYDKSTRDQYFEKCSHCNYWQPYDFFKNVVTKVDENEYELLDTSFKKDSDKDIKLICVNCGRPIDRYPDEKHGQWVREFENREFVGIHLSKLFASFDSIRDMWQGFQDGLVDPFLLQRFFNSQLGLEYVVKDSSITYEDIDNCIDHDYKMPSKLETGWSIMGVDVGKVFSVKIAILENMSTLRMVYIGMVRNLSDLYRLIDLYRVKIGCVDIRPETRISQQVMFYKKMIDGKPSRFFGVAYSYSITDTYNGASKIFTINRTVALDSTRTFLRANRLIYPANAKTIPGLYEELTAANRFFDKDANRYVWNEGSKIDNYHHSLALLIYGYSIYIGHAKDF